MEQQAKHRLTGGVILVVLLVLLIPELLSGPRPAPPPTPAQPDQAPMRAYSMDLGDSAHARAPVAPSTAAHPAAETVAPASSAPQPPVNAPASSAPAAPTVATAPVPQPTRQHVPAPAPRPAATPAHGAEHSAAAWTVQVGTFLNRENAARMVANLKSHGFSASITEASRNGRRLFRVRVGSERDRAAAQKLLGRLKAAGEKGGEVVPR